MERINEMLSGYEKHERDNRYGGQEEYYVMTESEYFEVFEKILDSCTKEMRKYIERYSNNDCSSYIDGDRKGNQIRTWAYVYAAVIIK